MLRLARAAAGRRGLVFGVIHSSSLHHAAAPFASASLASSTLASSASAHHHHRRCRPTHHGTRLFSSSGGGAGFPMDDALGAPVARATGSDPDFAVFGDDCLLKFRLSTYVAPGAAGMYKSNNARLFLEFTRKNAGGVYDWRATKRLSMTPEEIGLLLDSGPTEELIFKRSGMPPPGAGGGQQQGGGPPKEIKFIPTQTGDWVIHLSVDGETYEVTVTRGRKAVIKSLIHAALPAIFGWGKVTGQGQGAQGGQAQYYHMGGGDQYGGGGGGGVPF